MTESLRLQALARTALLEVTADSTVGELIALERKPDQVTDVSFAATRHAYRGWKWVVSVAEVEDGGEPTVLEMGLIPGPDAVVAPEWIPWSVRLAQWRAQQQESDAALDSIAGDSSTDSDDLGADGTHGSGEPDDVEGLTDYDDHDDDDDLDHDDDDDDLDHDDDDDEDDDSPHEFEGFDDDVDEETPERRSTHSGDLDGINIDDLDPDATGASPEDHPH